MNPDKLTDTEVIQLIKQIKEFLNHPTFSIPTIGKYRCEESLSDKLNGITYSLHIYREI